MAGKKNTQRLSLPALAVLCQRATDDPVVRQKAAKLKEEWHQLMTRDAAPELTAQEKQNIEAEKAALKKRMIELLAHIGLETIIR
jgi:hypothetical protein